jgi:hypothetical protein
MSVNQPSEKSIARSIAKTQLLMRHFCGDDTDREANRMRNRLKHKINLLRRLKSAKALKASAL